MAIKYKLIQKAQPGVVGGGVKKWYASLESDGALTIDDIVKEVEKSSALSEPDIRGVVMAVEYIMQNHLANGKTIRLEKLGTFAPSLSSDGVEDAKTFDADTHIKGIKVNYRPGKRITDSLSITTFKRS